MKKGFTLIETVIYLGLFGVIMVGVLTSSYALIEAGKRNQDSIAVQEEGTFLRRKLNWAVSGATEADTVGATTLVLTRPDLPADENPLTLSYDAGTQSITFERGSHGAVILNTAAFAVTGLVFAVVPSVNGRPPAVSADFLVNGQLFSFDAYLRK